MENEKNKLEEAGAFWIKTSKTGTQFLTGKIKSKSGEEISVIVFKNKYKTEGSNQPDYRIYFDNGPQKSNGSTQKTEEAQEAPKTQKAPSKKQPETTKNEDIPF